MNLSIIKGLVSSAKSCAKTGVLLAKAHAPEILVCAGIGGFGVTIYQACRATNEAHDLIVKKEDILEDIEERLDDPDSDYTQMDYERDIKYINGKTRNGLIKAYAPVVTMGLASAGLVLGGFGILNGRYIGAAAAYKTLEAGFGRYRGNVIDEFGEEVDWRMLNNVKKEDLDAALKERDENREIAYTNKTKHFLKGKTMRNYPGVCDYRFDSSSLRWRRFWNGEMMLQYLQQGEDQLNDKLKLRGYLTVNDVLEFFGMPLIKGEGMIIGWVYSPGRFPMSFVDIGIKNMPESEVRRILATTRNDDLYVNLHLNPMGIIYDIIGEL